MSDRFGRSASPRGRAPSLPAGCIGPITADTARAAGFTVVVQPEAYTLPAFTAAILAYFGQTNSPQRTQRVDDGL